MSKKTLIATLSLGFISEIIAGLCGVIFFILHMEIGLYICAGICTLLALYDFLRGQPKTLLYYLPATAVAGLYAWLSAQRFLPILCGFICTEAFVLNLQWFIKTAIKIARMADDYEDALAEGERNNNHTL